MKKLQRFVRLAAVLFVIIGVIGFWYGYEHMVTKAILGPPNCDNGYPNPPCDVVADPQPNGVVGHVHVWNHWFDVPMGLGAIGLCILYDSYRPDESTPTLRSSSNG